MNDRYKVYALPLLGTGIACTASGVIWSHSWMRWPLLMLGVGEIIVAAVLFVLSRRAKHNPLASSDWEPLPPVACAPVPAPSHPPKLSGPAAVALPMPSEPDFGRGIRVPSCWPADARREPVDIAPLPGVRPLLRALPPPEPRDPGIVSLADRRRKKPR